MQKGTKHILLHLDTELAKQGLNDEVTLVDAEIRKIGESSTHLLTFPHGYIKIPSESSEISCQEHLLSGEFEVPETSRYFEDGPLLKNLTFKDILDSYTSWYSVVTSFRKTLVQENSRFHALDRTIEESFGMYENFRRLMQLHQISPETNIAQFSITEFRKLLNSGSYERSISNILGGEIRNMFHGLLETHLFQQIYEHSGRNIAIIAGTAHTSQLSEMLADLGAIRKNLGNLPMKTSRHGITL